MPYETYGCSICGKQAPESVRKHGKFSDRMKWLRHHYQTKHPNRFREWYRR